MFQRLPAKTETYPKDPHKRFLFERRLFWDRQAQSDGHPRRWSRYYHECLNEVFGFLVEPGQRVLELGCGEGDLLAALKASCGVGVELSSDLKIVDMPIRYRERMYGGTNIQRWRHGLILLRMVTFAAQRIKFV